MGYFYVLCIPSQVKVCAPPHDKRINQASENILFVFTVNASIDGEEKKQIKNCIRLIESVESLSCICFE